MAEKAESLTFHSRPSARSARFRQVRAWPASYCEDQPMGHLFSVDLDGDKFDVEFDENQPGVAHYFWTNGPNSGYGFTQGSSDDRLPSKAEAEAAIRNFVNAIDPETGYL
jgi:hypothetical protein